MRPRWTSSRSRRSRREGHDFFGNRLTWIELDRAARRTRRSSCRRASRSRLSTACDAGTTPPWEDVRDSGVRQHRHRRRCRRRISCFRAGRCRSIRKSATMRAQSFPPGRPVLEGAIELMQRIKARFRLRGRRHDGDDDAADVVRAAPRRLPGLRAYHDLRAARPRPAGGLCQRISAHGPARRREAARRRRRDACLGDGVVRRKHGWRGLDPTNR